MTRSPRLLWLLGLTAALGALLFIWRLGSIGQVDETPALFAAAGRAMADSGDWLTPRVNGHPRFDKPVLIYWLIGGLSLLPRSWDPLGSWAASLPSALAMVVVMLGFATLNWSASLAMSVPRSAQTRAASRAARGGFAARDPGEPIGGLHRGRPAW